HGFFSFNIVGLTPGQMVTITIIFPFNIPTNCQYWKYHESIGWYEIPIGDNDGDRIITIQLTDGGLGDEDGIANGIIVDAGGIGLIKAIPVGGFTMFADAFDILAPWISLGLVALLTILAFFVIIKKRRGYYFHS
ncbi:MAG: hypothetical protein H3Z51_05210, partial [archaeon]|nr:hypothetical protein [archaeon]